MPENQTPPEAAPAPVAPVIAGTMQDVITLTIDWIPQNNGTYLKVANAVGKRMTLITPSGVALPHPSTEPIHRHVLLQLINDYLGNMFNTLEQEIANERTKAGLALVPGGAGS